MLLEALGKVGKDYYSTENNKEAQEKEIESWHASSEKGMNEDCNDVIREESILEERSDSI